MTRELNDILVNLNTEKIVEAHSNFLIEDEDLIAFVEEGVVDSEYVFLYADVLSRMEEGALTLEDQYMIYESYKSGSIDEDSYSTLVESGLIDMDTTKEFLLEDFMSEGTLDSVKKVYNNAVGKIKAKIGDYHTKKGNLDKAAKAYGHAAQRFNRAGNKAKAKEFTKKYSDAHYMNKHYIYKPEDVQKHKDEVKAKRKKFEEFKNEVGDTLKSMYHHQMMTREK